MGSGFRLLKEYCRTRAGCRVGQSVQSCECCRNIGTSREVLIGFHQFENFSGTSFSIAVFDAVFTVTYLKMDHKVSDPISFWSKILRPVAVRPSSQAVAIYIGTCKNMRF